MEGLCCAKYVRQRCTTLGGKLSCCTADVVLQQAWWNRNRNMNMTGAVCFSSVVIFVFVLRGVVTAVTFVVASVLAPACLPASIATQPTIADATIAMRKQAIASWCNIRLGSFTIRNDSYISKISLLE